MKFIGLTNTLYIFDHPIFLDFRLTSYFFPELGSTPG